MRNQRTHSAKQAEAKAIGSCLEAVAAIMGDDSRFSYAVHGVAVEAFSDRRIELGGVTRSATHSTLHGTFSHRGVVVDVFSVPIPIAGEPVQEPEA